MIQRGGSRGPSNGVGYPRRSAGLVIIYEMYVHPSCVWWAETDLLPQATPAELLPKGKSNVANAPYTLIDRVLAAAEEGHEKDDSKVRASVKGLREDVKRRLEGLEKVNR